jgi:colicin import membrane protein
MAERKSDRWISLTQSVLLHAVVIGALAYGFYAYKQQAKPPLPTLAIEGTVVGSKDLQPVQPQSAPLPVPPAPTPEPPPPEPVEDVGPPSPTPEEVQQHQQEEQQKLDEHRQAEEQRVALEKKQAEEKQVAERQAREEADKKRQQEQREAEAKRIADAKKKVEEKRKADEDKRRADEAKAREASEAELRRSLEAEEKLNAMRSSGAMVSWVGQIANRIQRAWLRPPSAKPGIDCVVHVTQVVGGAVSSVQVGECNGDAAVRQSIADAVLRASPLPPPPDPALFERDLEIRFRPQD